MPAFIDFYQLPSIMISISFVAIFLHWLVLTHVIIGITRVILFRKAFVKKYGKKAK